jgi:hypothetical protein
MAGKAGVPEVGVDNIGGAGEAMMNAWPTIMPLAIAWRGIRRYFHPRRRDTLHLQSASPVCADRTLDKSILHCGTGTFAYQHPPPTNLARKIQASHDVISDIV